MHNLAHWITAPAIGMALGLKGPDIITFTFVHSLIDFDHVTALFYEGGATDSVNCTGFGSRKNITGKR